MSYLDENGHEQAEHECPRPLEVEVRDFDLGGMFLSPAGRWETITDLAGREDYSARVTIYTDRTGPDYCWQFWRSDKLPYLPSCLTTRDRYVLVSEVGSHLRVTVTDSLSGWISGHVLLEAHQERGSGWVLADSVDGREVERVTLPSKARARSEVKRRARAHAKKLSLPVREGAR